MQAAIVRWSRLWVRVICTLFGLAALAAPALAQDADSGESYSIRATIEPPHGEIAARYQALAARKGVRSRAIYATEIDGLLVSGRQHATPVAPRRVDPVDLNGFGVLLALLLIAGALIGWAKFGGGGALLARAPRKDRPDAGPPESWKLPAGDIAGTPQDLLTQLADMPDRGAALVLLLRHCLMAAGAATKTRFARSDTERRAFARLPQSYAHHAPLGVILRAAELAHYGGRAVAEDRFAEVLATGRLILMERGGAHG